MIVIKTHAEAAEEREDLFSLDGTVYTIPKFVGAELSLEALERMRTEHEFAVIGWMMATVLGKDAWKALRTAKGLDPADLAAIIEVVRTKVMAPIEEEGKS